MLVEIGTKVDVGGGVGKVTKIEGDNIIVEGRYYNVDGRAGDVEPWRFTYSKQEFESLAGWDDQHQMWFAQDVKPTSYY